jgi:hypothetical protein
LKRRDHNEPVIIDNTGFNVKYWSRYYIYEDFEKKCIENNVWVKKPEAVRKALIEIAYRIIFEK